ncbi:MAG: hypothetical protein JNJ62_08910 [Pseudoxanthomonas mexicana]|nr:hypothetical protein [Pseudoxanthomonas mexicana]
MMSLLSVAVILYQLFFVLAQYLARKAGPGAALCVLVLSLIWTATHVFFPPLAILQTAMILGSFFVFRSKARRTGK